MKIGVTIDCPDPDSVASFWERFLGYERRPSNPGGRYVTIVRPADADGLSHVTFQRVPEPKEVKARVHLDLFVEDAQQTFDAMVSAGAVPMEAIVAGQWKTCVLQDPAGNEFCLIASD
jgi:predicted enzyme related to lactoylglutathione lyase